MQMTEYMIVWNMIKLLPQLHSMFIDKPDCLEDSDQAQQVHIWSKQSLWQIASLKKLMKKRKRRVCLNL